MPTPRIKMFTNKCPAIVQGEEIIYWSRWCSVDMFGGLVVFAMKLRIGKPLKKSGQNA